MGLAEWPSGSRFPGCRSSQGPWRGRFTFSAAAVLAPPRLPHLVREEFRS